MDMDHMGDMNGMDMSHMKMNGSGGMSMSMMKMYFHTGFEDNILFENWSAHSEGAMFGWCVLFFVLAVGYELLKYYRQLHLTRASVIKVNFTTVTVTDNGIVSHSSASHDSQNDSCQSTPGDNKYERPLQPQPKVRHEIPMLSAAHVIQTVLHMIQIFVSYILMLAFMYFNVWICLAVILGAGVGYFLVGSRRLTAYSALDDDHCH